MTGLTDAQAKIVSFLREYKAANDCMPTLQEIGARFGMSKNGARNHLLYIEKKGAIERRPGRARLIKVVDQEPFQSEESNSNPIQFEALAIHE